MRDKVDSPASHDLWPVIAVASCGLVWGGFWYPLRWLNQIGVSGAWVSLIFNGVSVLAPLPWVLRRHLWGSGCWGQLVTGLLLGTAFSLYTVSLVLTDVVHAVLLFYLTPLWSTLIGLLLLGERLTASRAAALLLGFGGMLAILGIDHGAPLPRNPGDWIALLSGLLWSVGSLRSFHGKSGGIAMTVFAFSLGGLVSSGAILGCAFATASPLASVGHIGEALPWVVALAITIYVPPNFLVLWAGQRIHPARVGILLTTEVLSGSVTAGLFSGEKFGWAEALGTMMIACAGIMELAGRP